MNIYWRFAQQTESDLEFCLGSKDIAWIKCPTALKIMQLLSNVQFYPTHVFKLFREAVQMLSRKEGNTNEKIADKQVESLIL